MAFELVFVFVNILQSHEYCIGGMMTARGSPRLNLMQSKVSEKKLSPKVMEKKKRATSSKGYI